MRVKTFFAVVALTGLAISSLSIRAAATADKTSGSVGQSAGDHATASNPSPAEVVPSNHARSSLQQTVGGAPAATAFGMEVRSIDGTGNNVDNPTWGSAGIQLLRTAPSDYGDTVSTPSGATRPSARLVSNTLCAQANPMPSPIGATDFVWQWGQFVDHDLDLAEIADPVESFAIPVPQGDPFFDPNNTGTQVIGLNRAAYDSMSGTDPANPRQQTTFITAFIDASNVYGSDPVRAAAVRLNDGSGKLKTGAGDLLPFNVDGLPNAGGPSPTLFLAGDVRCNEQVALTAMHTLFMREHNRLCDEIAAQEPGLSGEELYQRARAIVGAQMQVITYNEFLPILLGPAALSPYEGYDASVNPGITNMFATACYRLGHSMLSGLIHRLNADGQEVAEGHLPLRDAFFDPDRITNEGGIDPLLRGLAHQAMQQIDGFVVDDVRNFLFGPPGAGGLDLASLNIQRGRDHGLPDYNQTRIAFGLPPVTTFAEISSILLIQNRLEFLYENVDNVDVWIGTLWEEHLPDALVGPTLMAVLKDQFERLRDGDRFWYQSFFSGSDLAELEDTRLSDIIRRNTSIGDEIPDNVFLVEGAGVAIPTTSQWGIAVMTLLLVTIALLILRRARATA